MIIKEKNMNMSLNDGGQVNGYIKREGGRMMNVYKTVRKDE
jgi:hypothetical protein